MAFSAAQPRKRDVIAHFSASYDLVLPATRVAALVVFLLLMPAAIVLWGTPAHTADRWAWTITPNLTAVFLGSGYGAGAFFFWRTYRAERWHPSSAGVLGASAFAALMLLATLLHWDAFNHGHAPFPAAFAFWGWTSSTSSRRRSCSPCGGATAPPTRDGDCAATRSCRRPSSPRRAWAASWPW